jgi:hypothetical protein
MNKVGAPIFEYITFMTRAGVFRFGDDTFIVELHEAS